MFETVDIAAQGRLLADVAGLPGVRPAEQVFAREQRAEDRGLRVGGGHVGEHDRRRALELVGDDRVVGAPREGGSSEPTPSGTGTVRGAPRTGRRRCSDQRRRYGVKTAKWSRPPGVTAPGASTVVTVSCTSSRLPPASSAVRSEAATTMSGSASTQRVINPRITTESSTTITRSGSCRVELGVELANATTIFTNPANRKRNADGCRAAG